MGASTGEMPLNLLLTSYNQINYLQWLFDLTSNKQQQLHTQSYPTPWSLGKVVGTQILPLPYTQTLPLP